MNIKSISNFVMRKAGRQVLTMQKHSPTILFAAGVVGVVGTAVLASRATLKLHDVLEEAEGLMEKREQAHMIEGYTDQDYMTDGITIRLKTGMKIVGLYGPAIIVGGLSIAALTGSHIILNRRLAGVMAAYAALDKGFRAYRERVAERFGAEVDAELLYDMEDHVIVEETDEGPKTKVIKRPTGRSPYSVIFDESNINWNRRRMNNQFFIQCQQAFANDKLAQVGHVFLNEVYEMLGFPHTKHGAVTGWVAEPGKVISFGIFEDDTHSGTRFANGEEQSVWLDFNVDGIILDLI